MMMCHANIYDASEASINLKLSFYECAYKFKTAERHFQDIEWNVSEGLVSFKVLLAKGN